MNELQHVETVEPFTPERPLNGAYRHTPAPPGPPERPPRRGRGIVGPVILIGAGLLLLLNTTGLVPWDTWLVLWRLWPIIPIAIGLDILIGRRSPVGSAAVAAAMLVVLIGGVWLLASGMSAPGQETIAQPRAGASSAALTISPGVADLRIAASSDAAVLVAGTVDRARGESLRQDYSGDGGIARYTLESREASRVSPPNGKRLTWDLRLSREVPLALRVNSGVGQTTLDLTGLQLTVLDVRSGVGQTTITLPAQGRFAATIDCGIGEVIVRVPAGVAARVRVDQGLGGVSLPAGYTRQGDWSLSPGYDSAANRIDLDINGGIGRIVVEEVGGR